MLLGSQLQQERAHSRSQLTQPTAYRFAPRRTQPLRSPCPRVQTGLTRCTSWAKWRERARFFRLWDQNGRPSQ